MVIDGAQMSSLRDLAACLRVRMWRGKESENLKETAEGLCVHKEMVHDV